MRKLGTEMHFEGCNFRDDKFIDHSCNLIEDVEEYNCKTLPNNKTTMKFTKDYKEEDLPKVSHQKICKDFDNIQISCMAGICKNVSAVYQCTFEVSKIKPDLITSFTKTLLNLKNNSSQCTVRGSNYLVAMDYYLVFRDL